MRASVSFAASSLFAAGLAACGGTAELPVSAGMGTSPFLPPPQKSLLPTVHIAPAKGWPEGAKPRSAEGTTVVRFAEGPRSPALALRAAQRRRAGRRDQRPPKPDDGKGIKGWFMKHDDEARPAPACRAPTASRCCAMPTATASRRRARSFWKGSTRPSAWRWWATTSTSPTPTRCCAFPMRQAMRRSPRPASKVVDLPAGPINHHWTKNVIASRDGSQALRDRRLQQQRGRKRHRQGGGARRDLGGRSQDRRAPRLRVGAAQSRTGWPGSRRRGALWTAVNERDELGSDLVPDYMTSVRDGGFYGWPYSYYGQHVDDPREAAAARPGRQSDRARLCAGAAHRVARPGLRARHQPARAVSATGCSWASTARGIASRAAATR